MWILYLWLIGIPIVFGPTYYIFENDEEYVRKEMRNDVPPIEFISFIIALFWFICVPCYISVKFTKWILKNNKEN